MIRINDINNDIMNIIIAKLNNNERFLIKHSSNKYFKIIYLQCEECECKYYNNPSKCSVCFGFSCSSCNTIKLNCIDCNKNICCKCYVEKSYIQCIYCENILCNYCSFNKCTCCKNPLCKKHSHFLNKCLGCKQLTCENCLEQIKTCKLCKKTFYTTNCSILYCNNCQI